MVSWCKFFFNDTATTEIYTLSLHDALPISDPPVRPVDHRPGDPAAVAADRGRVRVGEDRRAGGAVGAARSEEHTSELQSRQYLVCRLLLEKKKEEMNNLTSPNGAMIGQLI